MKKPSKQLLDRWYAKAKRADAKATDGYALGKFDDRGFTFPGGHDLKPGEYDRHGNHQAHRSLEAIGGALYKQQTTLGANEDGDPADIAGTETAAFWRIVGHKANNLPPRYPHRALLVEVAERGALQGVVKKFGLTKRKGEWVWRKFLVDVCRLPPPKTTVPGRRRSTNEHPEEAPAPVRRLTKTEIEKLKYQPPEKPDVYEPRFTYERDWA